VQVKLALSLRETGEDEAALVKYEEAKRNNARNVAAIVNFGVLSFMQGQQEAPIAAFRKALAVKTTSTAARRNLGFALAKFGKWEESYEQFQKLDQNAKDTHVIAAMKSAQQFACTAPEQDLAWWKNEAAKPKMELDICFDPTGMSFVDE
jgi:tetratricopeptide (TPR) repeat protein